MNYTRKARKTYAAIICKVSVLVLLLSVAAYGFLVVGVVRAAAYKQQFTEKHTELSADIHMLEQEYMITKSSLSKDDSASLSLTDVTSRRIIDNHTLGVAFVTLER